MPPAQDAWLLVAMVIAGFSATFSFGWQAMILMLFASVVSDYDYFRMGVAIYIAIIGFTAAYRGFSTSN